jgi:hypothetical protein
MLKDRLLELIKHEGLNPNKFYLQTGLGIGFLDKVGEKLKRPSVEKISKTFPLWSIDYLQTGEGEMLKSNSVNVQFYDTENAPSGKKLIPLYDDVSTIGGNLPGHSANMESNGPPAEWIDPGDWFKNATAAIRHYGESMIEYLTGCILALKEVQDRRLLVPGKDYVIETSEYRMTKRVQLCDNTEYIRLYSTNEEKYDDGSLIYQPFNIPIELVNRIFEVLGYVVKKGTGTMVYSNLK